jgi:hypothetical protein
MASSCAEHYHFGIHIGMRPILGGLARPSEGGLGTVWLGRRRRQIRRLEDAVAEARAGQAQLSRRVELFEKIAAAAGLELDEPVAAAQVPPSLAAAQDQLSRGATVRLDVDGREFIAVVGGDRGDPREWWTAIRRMASRLGNAS